MRDFFVALKEVLYEKRLNILAMIITVVGWLFFANFVVSEFGQKYLDSFAYAILGWYWLAGVVGPFVERKLEKLFG